MREAIRSPNRFDLCRDRPRFTGQLMSDASRLPSAAAGLTRAVGRWQILGPEDWDTHNLKG